MGFVIYFEKLFGLRSHFAYSMLTQVHNVYGFDLYKNIGLLMHQKHEIILEECII